MVDKTEEMWVVQWDDLLVDSRVVQKEIQMAVLMARQKVLQMVGATVAMKAALMAVSMVHQKVDKSAGLMAHWTVALLAQS